MAGEEERRICRDSSFPVSDRGKSMIKNISGSKRSKTDYYKSIESRNRNAQGKYLVLFFFHEPRLKLFLPSMEVQRQIPTLNEAS